MLAIHNKKRNIQKIEGLRKLIENQKIMQLNTDSVVEIEKFRLIKNDGCKFWKA